MLPSYKSKLGITYLILGFVFVLRINTAQTSVNPNSSSDHPSSLLAVIRKSDLLVFNLRTAALVDGVVWGYKEGFSIKDYRLIKNSGLTHIAVASGMNLVLVVSLITAFMPKHKRFNLIAGLIAGLGYTLIVGFQPPIVRALIMLVATTLATLTGRPRAAYGGLIAAACLMLILDPFLARSVSFQLSFLATLGQVVCSTFTAEYKILNKFILTDLTQTLCAQIFTLPITVANFGNYPLSSVLANAGILWSIPWLMILGAIAGFAGIIYLPLGRLLALPVEGLSFYFWQVVGYFGSQLSLVLRPEKIDNSIYIAYYILLFALYLGWKNLLKIRKRVD